MRASTMFALIVAVLLSLGAVIVVKASGILGPGEPKKEPPPRMVLVAATNILEDTYIQASDVKLRPVKSPDEERDSKEGKLLPPVINAAVKRIAATNIPADTPLREEYLDPLKADDLSHRLLPCERAVNCCVHKLYCAGGLIKVGDIVDVQLITTVEGGDPRTLASTATSSSTGTTATNGAATRNASAIIVRNARVIARRNSLYPVNTPLGPDCCINYTLAMNPYRAGLTEFVKDKGVIALLPLSEAEKQVVLPGGGVIGAADTVPGRTGIGLATLSSGAGDRLPRKTEPTAPANLETSNTPHGVNPLVNCKFSIPGNPEYADEDKRVADYVAGLYTIGEHDLVRIFRLSYIPATPPPTPTRVERVSGVTFAGEDVFDPTTGRRIGFNSATNTNPGQSALSDQAAPQAGDIRVASAALPFGQGNSQGASAFRFRPPDANCLPAPTPPVSRRN